MQHVSDLSEINVFTKQPVYMYILFYKLLMHCVYIGDKNVI